MYRENATPEVRQLPLWRRARLRIVAAFRWIGGVPARALDAATSSFRRLWRAWDGMGPGPQFLAAITVVCGALLVDIIHRAPYAHFTLGIELGPETASLLRGEGSAVTKDSSGRLSAMAYPHDPTDAERRGTFLCDAFACRMVSENWPWTHGQTVEIRTEPNRSLGAGDCATLERHLSFSGGNGYLRGSRPRLVRRSGAGGCIFRLP